MGDELEGKSVAAGGDPVGACGVPMSASSPMRCACASHTGVISAIEGAVLRARRRVGAQRGVPLVAGVAVVAAVHGMEPAPVGVEDNGMVLGRTALSCRALLDGEAWVGFGR